MKICIYGAGASGGHLAVGLAAAGHDVSVVARGPHLAAILQNGLALRLGERLLKARVRASSDGKHLGAQDLVIVGTKATALASAVDGIAPLLRQDSLVLFPQNGMTWWYRLGLPRGLPDPPGLPIYGLADHFLRIMRTDQVLGGVIYSANEIEAPGVIKNDSPDHNRLDLGPIDGVETAAIANVRHVLESAGILSPKPSDIRAALWMKLIANMSGSTIAFVTGRTSAACRSDAGLRDTFRRLVGDGLAVAAAHGFQLSDKLDCDAMLAGLLPHKPSMLQDYEQQRPIEIGEILLAPVAFARARNVPIPTLDAFAALAANMAISRGLLAPEVAEGLWER